MATIVTPYQNAVPNRLRSISINCPNKPPSISSLPADESGGEATFTGEGPGVGDGNGVKVGNTPVFAPRVAAITVAGNGVDDIASTVWVSVAVIVGVKDRLATEMLDLKNSS